MVWKNLERWYDFPFPIPLKRSGVQNTERECYRGLQRFYAYYIYIVTVWQLYIIL